MHSLYIRLGPSPAERQEVLSRFTRYLVEPGICGMSPSEFQVSRT